MFAHTHTEHPHVAAADSFVMYCVEHEEKMIIRPNNKNLVWLDSSIENKWN